jgi:hypothetical protein
VTKHKIPKRILAIFQAAGSKGGKLAAKNMSSRARKRRARAAGKASVAARRAAKKRR